MLSAEVYFIKTHRPIPGLGQVGWLEGAHTVLTNSWLNLVDITKTDITYIYIYMFWQSVKQEEKETPSGLAYCQCVAEHKIVSSGRSAAKIDVRDDTMTELMFLSKSTTLRSSYTCRHSGHRLFPSMYGHNWCVQLSGFYSAAAFSLLPLMNEHGAALVWYCH